MKENKIRGYFAPIVFVLAFFLVLAIGAGSAKAEGESGESSPQKIVIEEAGTYVLNGKINGGVSVDAKEGNVILVLDNADITSEDGPAISAVNAALLQIELKEGTCNYISDVKGNTKNVAFYTEVDTVVDGKGCLQIEGRNKYGILAKNADITFNGGKSLVIADEYGFMAEGEKPGKIIIDGGEVFVNAKKGITPETLEVNVNKGSIKETESKSIKDFCGCTDCASFAGPAATAAVEEEEDEDENCCTPTTDKPGHIVRGKTTNGAAILEPDYANAVKIEMSAENNEVVISVAGTYIVSGKCDDGSITIKKDTKGVVLVLDNLELTKKDGSAIQTGDNTQVKIVVDTKAVVADKSDYPEYYIGFNRYSEEDQAVIKGGNDSELAFSGKGTLEVKGNLQNGIEAGERSSIVVDDKNLKVDVNAVETGIMSAGDVAIANGNVNITSVMDSIHSESIVEVGKDGGDGPVLSINSKTDGIESEVVNINGGDVSVKAGRDALESNDSLYGEDIDLSVNVMGGNAVVDAEDQGIDSDGDINLTDGSLTISNSDDSACMTKEGDLYISEDFELNCSCGGDSCEHSTGGETIGKG